MLCEYLHNEREELMQNIDRRILRKKDVLHRLGLSDATIWRAERDGKFPRRVLIGGRSVGWFSDEIDAWLEKKSEDRFLEAVR
jgi:prophage regulatory protein